MDQTKKRSSRISKAQKDMLVEFMTLNKEFARGQYTGVNGYQKTTDTWKELSVQLNSMGPIIKNADQWKKCWIDLKSGVRKLCSEKRSFHNKTGGGSFADRPRDLNEIEEKILSVITKDAIDGDGSTPEAGASSQIVLELNNEEELKSDPVKNVRSSQGMGYKSALEEAWKMHDQFEKKLDKVSSQNEDIKNQLEKISAQNEEILKLLRGC